jgi:hypothetical protein
MTQISSDEIQQAKETLKRNGCIAHIWSIEDVLDHAENLGMADIVSTPEEAMKILEHIERYLDSTCGITWQTLTAAIEDYQFSPAIKAGASAPGSGSA